MPSPPPIYLDHAATSPVLKQVLDVMLPYLGLEYGNPSAVYTSGRQARHTIDKCRADVAELLGVGSAEIIFTSGGSESNNTVIATFSTPERLGVISSKVEHEAILEPVKQLKSHRLLSPNEWGQITADIVRNEDLHSFELASFMLVNNELGVISPLEELLPTLRAHELLLHTDAVQAARFMDLREICSQVDYLSLSGHKIGGPKGTGVLFVRAGAPFEPLIRGGGQEQDRRAGTENVASIVGFTHALKIASETRVEFVRHTTELRDLLIDQLSGELKERVRFNSNPELGAPHILNLLLLSGDGVGVDGEMLILGLDIEGVYASAGSACSSGTLKQSHVLDAIGVPDGLATGSLRLSFGPNTTMDEVSDAAERIVRVVNRMTVEAGRSS